MTSPDGDALRWRSGEASMNLCPALHSYSAPRKIFTLNSCRSVGRETVWVKGWEGERVRVRERERE